MVLEYKLIQCNLLSEWGDQEIGGKKERNAGKNGNWQGWKSFPEECKQHQRKSKTLENAK
jgi:hypothetical protein